MDLEVMRLREIGQITILDDQTSLWNLNRRKTKLVGKASGLRVSDTDWSGPWVRPVGTTHTGRPSWRAGGSSASGAVAPGAERQVPESPPTQQHGLGAEAGSDHTQAHGAGFLRERAGLR